MFSDVCGLFSPAAIMFTVAMLQQATVKPPNIIAHEKDFKFHVQAQTGAYSCLLLCLSEPNMLILVPLKARRDLESIDFWSI